MLPKSFGIALGWPMGAGQPYYPSPPVGQDYLTGADGQQLTGFDGQQIFGAPQ